MAVFSFQIGDKSQDLPGAHIYGQDKAILLVKLQKNGFSPQRGFGTADLKDQVLQEQILDNGRNGGFCQFQLIPAACLYSVSRRRLLSRIIS